MREVSLLLALMWTLNAFAEDPADSGADAPPEPAAEEHGPVGAQSPCEWLIQRRDAGLPMTDLLRLADAHHDLFNAKDIRCLKKAGVHSRLVEAASGSLSRDREVAERDEAKRLEREAERAERDARREEEEARKAAEHEEALRNRYDVEIIGVVVGLAQQSGTKWDGFGSVPADVTDGALALLDATGMTAAGVGGLTTYIANQTLDATAAPDVYGYAEFVGPDAPREWIGVRLSLAPPQAPVADSYFVTFSGSPGYRGIKVQDGDAVRITLYDRDLTDDDAIGVLELTEADIRGAAEAGGIVAVEAASRTFNQILVLQVSVRPASTTRAEVSGTTFVP